MIKKNDKKVVSGSTDPSQSLERAAEIRKSGVRFPVDVRICFGTRTWFEGDVVR